MSGLVLQVLVAVACFGGVALIVWTINEWQSWAQPDPSMADGAPARRTFIVALAEVVGVLRKPGTRSALGGRVSFHRSGDGRGWSLALVRGDLVIGVGLARQPATRPARLTVCLDLLMGRHVLGLDVEATIWRLTPWLHASMIYRNKETMDG